MPDRIATELLLIARSPISGRIRHRAALEKGLRGALFADLALQDRISSGQSGPVITDKTPTGDRILDAVLATIEQRPDVAWRRWYHHVAADRVAITKQLVADGRWTVSRDRFGRASYTDTDPDATLVLVHAATQISELRQAPAGAREAILGLLTAICGSVSGRPRPRELRHSLQPLLNATGLPSDPIRLCIESALRASAGSVGRRSRILG